MTFTMTKMRLYVTTNSAHSPLKRQKDGGASCFWMFFEDSTSGLALVVKVVGLHRTLGRQINSVKAMVAEAK